MSRRFTYSTVQYQYLHVCCTKQVQLARRRRTRARGVPHSTHWTAWHSCQRLRLDPPATWRQRRHADCGMAAHSCFARTATVEARRRSFARAQSRVRRAGFWHCGAACARTRTRSCSQLRSIKKRQLCCCITGKGIGPRCLTFTWCAIPSRDCYRASWIRW